MRNGAEPKHILRIFYGKSEGRADVPNQTPVSISLDTALAIFRGLELRRGFMGVILGDRFVLQMMKEKNGKIRVELLDTSVPAFDAGDIECEFAEDLIRAAAEGKDVFQIARASNYEWEHLDMS